MTGRTKGNVVVGAVVTFCTSWSLVTFWN